LLDADSGLSVFDGITTIAAYHRIGKGAKEHRRFYKEVKIVHPYFILLDIGVPSGQALLFW
jgi:hypothetical protein